MKIAVSIPDPIFEAAERLAEARAVPRSQLYAEALAAYLAEHGPGAVKAQLDALYAAQPAGVAQDLEHAQFEVFDDEAW